MTLLNELCAFHGVYPHGANNPVFSDCHFFSDMLRKYGLSHDEMCKLVMFEEYKEALCKSRDTILNIHKAKLAAKDPNTKPVKAVNADRIHKGKRRVG